MIWKLGALKRLAEHVSVPGCALRDAISELELLDAENRKLRAALEAIKVGMLYPKEYAAHTLREVKERDEL